MKNCLEMKIQISIPAYLFFILPSKKKSLIIKVE